LCRPDSRSGAPGKFGVHNSPKTIELLALRTQEQPLRAELLSIDLLQRHARTLAQRHQTGDRKGHNRLLPRLASNERTLRAYNEETLRVERTRRITPAAEWLLDNFYLIEDQVRTARRHLPKGYSRELPHLTSGPMADFPRVYDLALELIAHVDGRIDSVHLTSFIAAYQEVTPLKLGELWAIPIMLRLALIENLRRVASQLTAARKDRDLADEWADRMLSVTDNEPSKLIVVVAQLAQSGAPLSEAFVTEFWRRLQQKSPTLKLAVNWLEERLAAEGMSIEHLVQNENQNQAADQVSVGNSISSMRFLDAMDWREFVETLSAVEQALRTDPAGVYADMDFTTRDSYRHIVETVARHSELSEREVAELAIKLAQESSQTKATRQSHVGYYLLDDGLPELEKAARARPHPGLLLARLLRAFPLTFYLGGIGGISTVLTLYFLWVVSSIEPPWWTLALACLLVVVCASQLAVALVNWLSAVLLKPRPLPRLDFSDGIPPQHRTLVVIPTMLTNRAGTEHLLEGLEVRYLANRDANIYFGLLTDFCDANQESVSGDEDLVAQVRQGVEALNEKYREDRSNIFYLFHRRRCWNERERVWMGYERKRGKLAALNRLLRGGDGECFDEVAGDLSVLPHIKYVITLDTDTQLPRDAARHLAGTIAHSLNRPVYDATRGRVVNGYSILQPRVAVSLPGASRSRFARLFSGDPGIDPYTRTVSDVYQDLFQEGSFIGKGIYDVDTFEQAVGGKLPENRILSHDLLEGSYARSGLVTDVQLFEEFPARYTADTQRRHRWMRGDWQIAHWLLPRVPGSDVRRVANPISGLSRWKIFDNLRRSLVPIALAGLLILGWSALPEFSLWWSLFVVAVIFLPGLLMTLAEMLFKPRGVPLFQHLRHASQTSGRLLGQALLTLMFLPFDAVVSLDATMRTIGRLMFTRRNLLEWRTASEAEKSTGTDLKSYWITMWCAPAMAVLLGFGLFVQPSPAWPVALPILVLWLCAPLAAWWISLPIEGRQLALSAPQKRALRLVARKTWRYFETFVSAEDHWLPPDNYQEHPKPVLATRTSPTNIGMGLISTLAARDFGYLSVGQLSERLGRTLQTLAGLSRYNGHFYNWYDTRTLEPLFPLYVSTVDNGSLAGLLLTLREGLLEVAAKPFPVPTAVLEGLRDTLGGWIEATRALEPVTAATVVPRLEALEAKLSHSPASPENVLPLLNELLEEIATIPTLKVGADSEFEWWHLAFAQLCREHRDEWVAGWPWLKLDLPASALPQGMAEGSEAPSLAWLESELNRVETALANPGEKSEKGATPLEPLRDALAATLKRGKEQAAILHKLVLQCDEFAKMDFTFLYDTARKLFSIGYNVTHHRLDASHYDLLASEARLTSFVAIALGQISQEHWFALGRLLTAVDGHSALLSWSGSMFEYLMPPLVMPTYDQTLLDVSCRAALARQIHYAHEHDVPWGISESCYNLTDAQSNYQYRAFGAPGLGFKRGLAEDIVISPYSTLMAFLIAPQRAWANLQRLKAEGAEGRYGYYEALDYTPNRVVRGKTHAVLRTFMAHHQGMGLLGLTYCLLDRPMQRRFQANPAFRAAELLLQERVPKETPALFPHELEANRARDTSAAQEATFRVFTNPNQIPPDVHLLSNGRYHVMLTSAGSGYSLWNDVALTRWREDPTLDGWGSFIYLRDRANRYVWSAAHQPTQPAASSYEAIFSQGRAEYRMRFQEIDSHVEIAVSPEDDIEVRRVTLTNHSSEPRTIDVTSFAEVALNSMAADQAHPAFSKLFVQTEVLPKCFAIVCSRRPRARGEKPPWLFHLMLVQGEEAGEPSFETDRAQFLGRGRTAAAPAAMEARALSNTSGSVLDPAMAIRRAVQLEAKQSRRLTLVTGSAATREAVFDLVEKYQDQSLADRVFELAWTHGLVTLRHLDTTEPQAQLFGRLAGSLLYSHPLRRASEATLLQNRRGQRNLWSLGISGDLPIVVLRATDPERIGFVRELLTAHAYWRLKGLAVDLVILNEDDSVYRQSIHDQIMSLIGSGIEANMLDKPGGVFVRRVDQLSHEDNVLLQSSARLVLTDEDGTLAEQLQRKARVELLPPALIPSRARYPSAAPPAPLPTRPLTFFNGLGGFAPDGREYVMLLRDGQMTPAPWVNVIGNPGFGTLVSENGSSYTWAENCHEFRLTPWHNDPVSDPSGETFYIRDEQNGRFWSPTPLPAGSAAGCVVRHGFGYSVFEMVEDEIASELWTYVAVDAPVKFLRLVLRNQSTRERSLSVTGFWEWVLGETRAKNFMHIATEFDPRSGAMLARNPYNTEFEGRVAFVAACESIYSFTGSRTEFIGRNGQLSQPAAMGRQRLSGKVGIGLDACAALRVTVTLAPGQQREVVFKLGAARNREEAQSLLQRFRRVDACRDAIYMVRAYWNDALSAVEVETPDPALNFLANGWLLYQTLSARLFARTGFFQSGGAFGFRDQLQDAMALIHSRPHLLRELVLRAAGRQFREGDVQHWWHPPNGRGVRTHFSDDYLWLPYAVCRYVEALGDTGVLDESVPFLEGRPLRADEEAYYDSPAISAETGTLYEHCVRAIRHGLRFGKHGLPLIGCGDWNDGMNLVGEHGQGESVWVAFFLHDVLTRFSAIARAREDQSFVDLCLKQARRLRDNIENHAWDGRWYRRAYFDNGQPLGSATNPECQIDSLPQSWSVLTGVGDEKRARSAMDAVEERLVQRDARLIRLFDPPFDKSPLEPGYIKGYLPGVRENGGQYTHGAIWTVMAFAALGDARRAWEFFNLINPIRHGDSPAAIATYKAEPYVVAADVYSVPPHVGRGGWTWYTGSAGWLYRLITESLLGLKLEVDRLRFKPCLPAEWKSYRLRYRYRETNYHITLLRSGEQWGTNATFILDGIPQSESVLPLKDDRHEHQVEIRFS
jgi:cellobiose phosphorylase